MGILIKVLFKIINAGVYKKCWEETGHRQFRFTGGFETKEALFCSVLVNLGREVMTWNCLCMLTLLTMGCPWTKSSIVNWWNCWSTNVLIQEIQHVLTTKGAVKIADDRGAMHKKSTTRIYRFGTSVLFVLQEHL